MDKIVIKTKDLDANFQVDGLSVEGQVKNIENFYGIPATLHSVDKKFNTRTFRDVLEAAAPTLELLVENDKVQVLDPRSSFMKDEEFDQLITIAEQVSGISADRSNGTFQRQAVIKLKDSDSDSFLGDVFARSWTVVRRAEGGLSFSTDITRLACTNGMVIPDKQFSGFIRSAKVEQAYLTGFHDTAVGFSVEQYMKSLFMHNGNPIQCSLADLQEMHQCLSNLTQDDLADMLFPVAQVQEFYAAQNIDITKLARKYLDKLPTGLSYYQALNILTNGAKAMVEKTIDNQIKVARFCQPKRMQDMKDVDLHWEGLPVFSEVQIHTMMGDGIHIAPRII